MNGIKLNEKELRTAYHYLRREKLIQAEKASRYRNSGHPALERYHHEEWETLDSIVEKLEKQMEWDDVEWYERQE